MSTSAPSWPILSADPLGIQRRLVGPFQDRVRSAVAPTLLAQRQLAGAARALDAAAAPAGVIAPRRPAVTIQASADQVLRQVTDSLRRLYAPPAIMTAQLGVLDAVRGFTDATRVGIAPYDPALDALRDMGRVQVVVPAPIVRSPQLMAAVEALQAAASVRAPVGPPPAGRPLVLDEHQVRQQAASLAVDLAEDPVAMVTAREVLERPELQEVVRDPRVRREVHRLADSVWPPSTDGFVAHTAVGLAVVLAVVVSVLMFYGYGDDLAKVGTAATLTLLPLTVLGGVQVVNTARKSRGHDGPAVARPGDSPPPGAQRRRGAARR